MKVYVISTTRKVVEREVERSVLTKTFGVHLRDLRPVLTQKQVATVLRREKCIIVNVLDIKLIIGEKEAFLLDTGKNRIKELIESIQSPDEKIFKALSFELFLIDRLFLVAFSKIGKRVGRLSAEIQRMIPLLMNNPTDEGFEKLLGLKRHLTRNATHIEDIDELLEGFLQEDSLKDLSFRLRPTQKELNEIESIIENLYEQIEQIQNELEDLDDTIDDTQDIVSLKIANKRNRIIRFNMLLTYVGTLFAFMAMITGIFGMNLMNHQEANPEAFIDVIYSLVGVFIFSTAVIYIYLWRNKLL